MTVAVMALRDYFMVAGRIGTELEERRLVFVQNSDSDVVCFL